MVVLKWYLYVQYVAANLIQCCLSLITLICNRNATTNEKILSVLYFEVFRCIALLKVKGGPFCHVPKSFSPVSCCSGMVDVVFADVAQPDQARIVAINAHSFLKNQGHFVISIKVSEEGKSDLNWIWSVCLPTSLLSGST